MIASISDKEKIVQIAENALEALNSLLYLIDHSANDPNKVREYVRWAWEPLRVLEVAHATSQAPQDHVEPK